MDTASTEQLLRSLGKQKGPAPVHLWNPPYCGEIDIRIAADGRWYHEGAVITRLPMVQLFSSILRRDPDNHFYLVTPAERVRIKVDDCPFVAQLLDVDGEGASQQLRFTLNTGEQVIAGPDNVLAVGDDSNGAPHPTLHVRHGLCALISRSVFYQLIELAALVPLSEDDKKDIKNKGKDAKLVLRSAGKDFDFGAVCADL
ncbi:DUF1285 domain-containing protein [Gammaproteobacteria bacterium LSUCC0112]|nr:DUF1285 domain-containing protein [Gammaproteobacteria bacterium LSUCC0112]